MKEGHAYEKNATEVPFFKAGVTRLGQTPVGEGKSKTDRSFAKGDVTEREPDKWYGKREKRERYQGSLLLYSLK